MSGDPDETREPLVAGSQDPALTALEDALRAALPAHRIALSPIGGEAGLAALARGEVHAAAVCGVLPDGVLGLRLTIARRAVGLVVARGNPLGIRTLDDLLRADVRTPPEVERSAVRLSSRTLPVASATATVTNGAPVVHGGRHGGGLQQELSSLAVAAAVQSGLADAGIGTAAAAAALGIDFVPVADEDVVLLLREDFADSDAGRALLDAARGARFRTALGALPGYAAV